MERRSAEKQKHDYSDAFMAENNIYDLQGLLMGGKNKFTAAVEAFSLERDVIVDHVGPLAFTDGEWKAKLSLMQAVGEPLFLFVHRDGSRFIHRYEVTMDNYLRNQVEDKKITEEEFINWWRDKKRTIQNKPYRAQLNNAIGASYFDNLLEANGLKWGGNIDGFMIIDDGTMRPRAIIENRFTRKEGHSIHGYDPAQYFLDPEKKDRRKSDYMTWWPLVLLSEILDVPLFLCTFSTLENEEQIMGVTQIDRIDHEHLYYVDNLKPCDNLFCNRHLARQWIDNAIRAYEEQR